jgi:hypothetical protein
MRAGRKTAITTDDLFSGARNVRSWDLSTRRFVSMFRPE